MMKQPGSRGRTSVFGSQLALLVWAFGAVNASFVQEHGQATQFISDAEDSWITKQVDESTRVILANIGPPAGANDGLVIASPSRGQTNQPNYYFTWTRDSALTITSLLPLFLPEAYLRPWTYDLSTNKSSTFQPQDPSLEPLIRSYVSSQRDIQLVDTRSGNLTTGGLSEPKYEVNGTAFNGDWGRPQRDGPALRALTVIPYAHFLLDRGYPADIAYVKDQLWNPAKVVSPGNLIKNDIEETASRWSKEGFDIWEEVNGHHLFTRLASFRALQAGAILAARLDDVGAAEWYASQASRVEARLANFWVYDANSTHGYWAASISGKNQLNSSNEDDDEDDDGDDLGSVLKGLDCALPLSVIHSGARRTRNSSEEHSWNSFEPSHPGVLSTLRSYARSFDGVYPVNKGDWTEGWLVGRYRDDVYDGVGTSKANPWFICTHSVAEVLYLAHTSLSKAGAISVGAHTVDFWSDVVGTSTGQTEWKSGEKEFDTALGRLWDVAEAYFNLAHAHAGNDGSMSEQIDRINGTQRGARQLTWSHASLLDAVRARTAAEGQK